jgi:hypothetical protein
MRCLLQAKEKEDEPTKEPTNKIVRKS